MLIPIKIKKIVCDQFFSSIRPSCDQNWSKIDLRKFSSLAKNRLKIDLRKFLLFLSESVSKNLDKFSAGFWQLTKIFQDRFLTNFWPYEGLKGWNWSQKIVFILSESASKNTMITLKYYDNIKIGLELENKSGGILTGGILTRGILNQFPSWSPILMLSKYF